MTDELDFDQLIELLDKALTSNDPNVHKALKKFLFIVTLSKDTDEVGPFAKLMERMEELDKRLAILEAERAYKQYPTYPGGCWDPNHSGKITWGGGTGSSTTTIKVNGHDVPYGSLTDGTSTGNVSYTYTIPQGYGAYSMNSDVSDAIDDLDDIIKRMA